MSIDNHWHYALGTGGEYQRNVRTDNSDTYDRCRVILFMRERSPAKLIGDRQMFSFHEQQLRVTAELLRRPDIKDAMNRTRFVVLEHALQPVAELLGLLKEAGAEIHTVIVKPYTIDGQVLDELRGIAGAVLCETYDTVEQPGFLEAILKTALTASAQDRRRVVIVEVGGYFAAPLSRMSQQSLLFPEAAHLAGVVEDTTFGHNRYIKLCNSINVPVMSVARSSLKEIEARFVGNTTLAATDQVLRGQGISLAGRRALVIGYGMIGKNIARSARAMDLTVSVYDKRDNRNLRAFSLGFRIHQKLRLLPDADIIFSATGTPDGRAALSADEIRDHCKPNVVLASAGSKDVEFEIARIKDVAINSEAICRHITRYVLPNDKPVFVMRGGTAVNFIINSAPTEAMDLVFAEILECCVILVRSNPCVPLHAVHSTPQDIIDRISHDWLQNVNY